jgi:hypothetical protein
VQPLRRVQDEVIKAVGAGPVARQGGEHELAAKPPAVPVPAALPKVLSLDSGGRAGQRRAGGAGTGACTSGVGVSQPDREPRIVVR